MGTNIYDKFIASLPKRPVFKISFSEQEGTYLNSKIGGDFFWKDNNPPKMIFIAQINFAELPENDIFPKEGMLQFFVGADDAYGYFNDEPNRFLIMYHKTINGGHAERRFYHDTPIQKNSQIEFEFTEESLSAVDYRYSKYGEKYKEVYDDIYKLIPGYGSKLLGYPFFTQCDPRKDDDEHSILLFQLDSDKTHVMWGDYGVANFFIDEESLKNMDFSNVLYYWDCC